MNKKNAIVDFLVMIIALLLVWVFISLLLYWIIIYHTDSPLLHFLLGNIPGMVVGIIFTIYWIKDVLND